MSRLKETDPLYSKAQKLLEEAPQTILIHSDLLRSFRIRTKPFDISRHSQAHIDAILGLLPGRDIWMPSFNYDFCKGSDYHLRETPSQVGHLSEYFRTNYGQWRSNTPVFNFAGIGEMPSAVNLNTERIDCFDTNSLFHKLREEKGLILHYGSPFPMSMTIMHYTERVSGALSYRYDKIFRGNVIADSGKKTVALNYHVRPQNGMVQYDWTRFEEILENLEILKTVREGKRFISVLASDVFCDWLIAELKKDPLFLLTADSRTWVEEKLNKLGRNFRIDDFE